MLDEDVEDLINNMHNTYQQEHPDLTEEEYQSYVDGVNDGMHLAFSMVMDSVKDAVREKTNKFL